MNQKPHVNITYKTIINSKVVPVLTLNLVTGNWSRFKVVSESPI